MGTVGIILNTISTVCSAGSLALFLYWLMEYVSLTYQSGLAMQSSRGIEGEFLPGYGSLTSFLNRLASVVLPLAEEMSRRNVFGLSELIVRWECDLVRAGLRGRISAQQFLATILLTSTIPALFLALLLLLLGLSLIKALLLAILMGALPGLFFPVMALRGEVKNRVAWIEKRLPFAIEFMVLALEARAVFQHAIEVYCTQMGSDALADELRIVLGDIDKGLGEEDALTKMAKRIESDDVSTFVIALTAGRSAGQPLKAVLHTQSNLARQRRFQLAEHVAKTAATRAIFPLFLTVIAVLILLIGPLAIRIAQQSLF